MILAAGLGTRLRPLTNTLPKPLIPINGRPLIEYTLLLLKKYQIQEIIINIHHHGRQIRNALGSGSRWGLKISYSDEPEILGTGGGLKKVESFLSDGTFLVINGDILTNFDLNQAALFHARKKSVATLVLREDPDADSWGALEIDAGDRVRTIRGQPPQNQSNPAGKRMFSGIHILDPRIFRYLPGEAYSNIMDVYLEMIKSGESIAGFTMDSYWMDIGTPERYQLAQEDLRKAPSPLSYLP